MIQDIYPKIFNNSYTHPKMKETDYVLVFNDEYLCMKEEKFFQVKDFKKSHLTYAFQIDKNNIFICDDNIEKSKKILIKDIRYKLNKELAFIAYTAHQLYLWINENTYCGRCGNKTIFSNTERAIICEKCKNIIYPKLSPAIIVAITNKDEILLTKYKSGYSKYALVAGYCEIGESLEETIKREVLEEVGLKVKNIKYYKSQPWALSSSLLVGFTCELDGNPAIKIDNNELKEAIWVKRDEMKFEYDDISLTHDMMKAFKENII